MKRYLSISIASILALSGLDAAKAQFTITADIGGIPTVSGVTLENFNEPAPSILTLSGPASLSLTPGTGAPYFSGSTAAYFGETPATGYDTSQFVSIGPGGSATLGFATPQHYLGLCWGSIDPYAGMNVLTFYDMANNVIGTVQGGDVMAANNSLIPGGTAYVNITSTTAFTSVVASAVPYYPESFEFDDVAYVQPVPEPVSGVIFGAGFCILGFALRRKIFYSGRNEFLKR